MPGNVAMTPAQAEAFDILLDRIAEEVIERYLAELEEADFKDDASEGNA